MRVGIIGTGAIARKHAAAYANIGFPLIACTSATEASGERFATETGAKFVRTAEELCSLPQVDYVDVCTPPSFRLDPVRLCAQNRKHILVEKPMAVNLATARQMLELAGSARIEIGVISQHRFDDSTRFLKRAIEEGRLGAILEADAYVKWYRPAEYYGRAFKGTWEGEGGGALITQAIHQVDVLLYLVGGVTQVLAQWQIGALHRIESEDCINALLRFRNGATGVIQASTAIWPGYPERLEIHGTKGSAVITGDKITTWDIQGDAGEEAPLSSALASGASDPMAISTLPLERQMLDFAHACQNETTPLVSGREGFRALELVTAIYEACRTGRAVELAPNN